MTLTSKQKNLIADIDWKVKAILEEGGNEETILLTFINQMPEIFQLLEKDIDIYYQQYYGFYHYMKTLENLAQKISDGTIKVPR